MRAAATAIYQFAWRRARVVAAVVAVLVVLAGTNVLLKFGPVEAGLVIGPGGRSGAGDPGPAGGAVLG